MILERHEDVWGIIGIKCNSLSSAGLRAVLLELFKEMKALRCFEPAIGPGRGNKSDKFYVEWPEHGLVFVLALCEMETSVSFELLQASLVEFKPLKSQFTLSIDKIKEFPFRVLPHVDDEIRYDGIVLIRGVRE